MFAVSRTALRLCGPSRATRRISMVALEGTDGARHVSLGPRLEGRRHSAAAAPRTHPSPTNAATADRLKATYTELGHRPLPACSACRRS
jgi:hypothetical protein